MGLMGGNRDRRMIADFLRHGDIRPHVGYLAAVRHPWPSFIFVVFLLAAYEAGVVWLSPTNGPSIRAGVELWLREWLKHAEPCPPQVIPGTLIFLLAAWALWKWHDRPNGPVIPLLGIVVESVAFGFGLWILCLNAPALFDRAGVSLADVGRLKPETVTFLGVGIYEEAIFRLLAFAWLARFLNLLFVPWLGAVLFATILSAAAFSLAHNLVQGEPFVLMAFALRMVVGVFLALVFWLRGLGVAIGAHVVYNLVVSAHLD